MNYWIDQWDHADKVHYIERKAVRLEAFDHVAAHKAMKPMIGFVTSGS
jgi:hypothetical protein